MTEAAVRLIKTGPNRYEISALSPPAARKLTAAFSDADTILAHLILPDQKVNQK